MFVGRLVTFILSVITTDGVTGSARILAVITKVSLLEDDIWLVESHFMYILFTLLQLIHFTVCLTNNQCRHTQFDSICAQYGHPGEKITALLTKKMINSSTSGQ